MFKSYILHDCPTTRIDRWLKRQFPTLHQSQIEKWLRSKDILVNKKKVESSFRVDDGDIIDIKTVIFNIIAHQASAPKEDLHVPKRDDADTLASWILYDDEEIIVLNKPSGVATQGGTGMVQHVDKMLKAYAYYYGKERQLRLVHRLDRDTSGILIIAKTLKVANHLAEQFKFNAMDKMYWAICYGKPNPQHGEIDAPLIKKNKPSGDGEAVYVDLKQGKKAKTSYRIIKSFGKLCWVELKPHTGRTHQLRVHTAYIDTPILGDNKYGHHDDSVPLHLHARSLKLETLDGDHMTFTAPPPIHMIETLKMGVKATNDANLKNMLEELL